MLFYFLVAPLMSMRPNNLSVILKRLFCNTCTFTMLSPLFGSRQQRVRRSSNNGCDGRQQRVWRPSNSEHCDVTIKYNGHNAIALCPLRQEHIIVMLLEESCYVLYLLLYDYFSVATHAAVVFLIQSTTRSVEPGRMPAVLYTTSALMPFR